MKNGSYPLVDPFNLPETYPGVHGKRNKESREEGSLRPQEKKKKKKVVEFLDEDKVPLSERQRQMLLKDISGIVQRSTEASSETTSGKLPKASNLVVFYSVVSGRILPNPPPPNSKPPSYFSQHISKPILLPPPTETPILEPITKTPIVYETLFQQQQHQIPPTPPLSYLLSSPIPPPSQTISAPHIENPKIKTPRTSPS